MRQVAGVRFRTGVKFILWSAKERGLILYPIGILGLTSPNFIAQVDEFTHHLALRSRVSELLLDKLSKSSAIAASAYFDRFLEAVDFTNPTKFSHIFFQQFWG